MWVKREADLNSCIPVSQLHVKQLRSLAKAVQAQEDATTTGTYLFMEQPRELTSQMSDGTRCHWTEGSSKESLEHRMGWNLGDDLEDDAEPMPPGPSCDNWYQQIDLLKYRHSPWRDRRTYSIQELELLSLHDSMVGHSIYDVCVQFLQHRMGSVEPRG